MKKIINEAVIASEAKQSQTFRLLRPVHHVGRPRNDGFLNYFFHESTLRGQISDLKYFLSCFFLIS